MEEVLLLKRRLKTTLVVIFSILIFCIIILIVMNKFVLHKSYYKASDFKIKNIYSKVDFNKNGIDDYSDILLGAKKSINKNITEEEFIINAFKYAGYDINKMIKKDTIYNEEKDTLSNIKEYLKKNVKRVTKNINKIEEFQQGDILIFNNKIGIISDKRNKYGNPFLVYHDNKVIEKDILRDIDITYHYRFDSSLIKDELLTKSSEK